MFGGKVPFQGDEIPPPAVVEEEVGEAAGERLVTQALVELRQPGSEDGLRIYLLLFDAGLENMRGYGGKGKVVHFAKSVRDCL